MKLVLVGAGDLARLAYPAFAAEDAFDVVACAVSREYVGAAELESLPVVAFEDLEQTHPPDSHSLFVAVGYRRVNRGRRELFEEARSRGYTLAVHRSPHAYVAPGVELRANTFVFEGAIIQPFVTLGEDVIVWSGAVVAHDTRVGDHCFIAPNASISGKVTLGDNCFVGINATIRDGVTIAPDCVIGAGAVIKHDTQPGEVYSARATAASARSSSDYDDL
jgi:sugar O-acyltransferase (sialic acid O-acetyltransferase NeuD family)